MRPSVVWQWFIQHHLINDAVMLGSGQAELQK